MNTLQVKNMDINVDLNNVVAIIGPANSGKTYLLKKLCNIISNEDIFLDDICIRNYDVSFLKNNLCVVLDDNIYNTHYVYQELEYYLKQLNYTNSEIKIRIKDIADFFKINEYLDYRIEELTVEYKMLIKILSLLIIKPQLIAIDNLICYLSDNNKKNLFKYIKDNNVSIIYTVSNAEELLYSDVTIVLNNLKSVLCTKTNEVVEGNSILPYMGIKLPFAADLSQNLILYGLVDKVYLDNRKLVNKIWK